jgi:hypothetical protein
MSRPSRFPPRLRTLGKQLGIDRIDTSDSPPDGDLCGEIRLREGECKGTAAVRALVGAIPSSHVPCGQLTSSILDFSETRPSPVQCLLCT